MLGADFLNHFGLLVDLKNKKLIDSTTTLNTSSTLEEHIEHLTQVFNRLRQYGISINIAKCQFGKSEINYLGYLINGEGTRPLPERVASIQEYPQPATIADMRRQFTTHIVHVSGVENVIADALSRIDAIAFPVIVSTAELCQAQQSDEELSELKQNSTSLQLRPL
ncbi:hypothetical protein YQE_02293, partial [Dendroctonus ponderosae]